MTPPRLHPTPRLREVLREQVRVIRDVSKTYPNGVQALKDVTLTIPRGCTACSAPTAPASPR
jgi:hypothetical protein